MLIIDCWSRFHILRHDFVIYGFLASKKYIPQLWRLRVSKYGTIKWINKYLIGPYNCIHFHRAKNHHRKAGKQYEKKNHSLRWSITLQMYSQYTPLNSDSRQISCLMWSSSTFFSLDSIQKINIWVLEFHNKNYNYCLNTISNNKIRQNRWQNDLSQQ